VQFASIGSGSKGNGTLIRDQQTLLLMDCGFTLKETEKRLQRLGVDPSELSAILVTHEHTDHAKGIGPLSRRYQVPVYATHGTQQASRFGELKQFQPICMQTPFAVGSIRIQPVAVPHDAREACQFVFENDSGARLGVLTDCGSLTVHMHQHYQGCHALLLECNHDPDMLAQGPYPPSLKQRVGGAFGHLSNQQAAQFLTNVMCDQLQHLYITHISEKNNRSELAIDALASTNPPVQEIVVIDQELGLEWQQIEF
jgi:phosphoribosyl 1,2-cyclic phosphodiesterase